MNTRSNAKAQRSSKSKPTTPHQRRRPVQYRLPQEWIGANSQEAPARVRRMIIQHAEAETEGEE
jgi:hypothetical protein